MRTTRRSFIKSSAAGTAGLVLAPTISRSIAAVSQQMVWQDKMPVNPAISNMRVVCCHDPEMVTRNPSQIGVFSSTNDVIDAAIVSRNMDQMAMLLAQQSTPEDSWKTIFRSGKPWNQTKAAIKINGVMSNLARAAVVKKITEVMVDLLGMQPTNIVVYDGHGNAAGNDKYTPYGSPTDPSKIRAIISEKFSAMGGVKNVSIPVTGTTLSGVGPTNLVDGITDILVNIAVNKGHLSQVGTTTLCLKAHFGTFLDREGGSAEFMHHNLTDAVININKLDPIIGGNPVRQQLCIIDSIFASQGGPGGNADTRLDRLIMGTFAGAVDYCCVKKVREGEKNWRHDNSVVAKFLTSFGYNEEDPEWVEMTPTGITTGKVNPHSSAISFSFTLSHPALRTSTLHFTLPFRISGLVQAEILDLRGSHIRQLSADAATGRMLWDGKAENGRSIGAGSYIVVLTTGRYRVSERMTLVR
jgi:hypothetical protein